MNQEQVKKRKMTLNQYFSLVSFLNFIAIIFTIIFLIYSLYNSNSFKGHNIDEYSNNYCKNASNEYYEFICTNKYQRFNFKKSKFIWIMTDGTAYDQLTILNNFEKYKLASPILINGDDVNYKHTNEMHETLITGKHNRNFKGNEVQGDNLYKQFADAGYKINFRGWSMPTADMVGDKKGGKNENKIFNKKFIDNDDEIFAFSSFCNLTNPFPFMKSKYLKYQEAVSGDELNNIVIKKLEKFIQSKKMFLFDNFSKSELYEELDEIFRENNIDIFSLDINECLKKSFDWNETENISVVYYTTEVDISNHYNGKAYIYTILQTYITEKMIEQLIKWVDKHEDYALIITSDHGGANFLGEEMIRLHGIDCPGNEAILFIYTKELREHYDELKMQKRYIHMIDANEILSQILLNINIPINSKGFPINLFNDSVNTFTALKTKEIQLIQMLENYLKKYPYLINDLKDLLSGLKDDFSQINYIIGEYIKNEFDDLEDDLIKREEFKIFIKKNEKFLYQIQSQLQKILYNRNISISNKFFMAFICAFLLFKLFFEYRILIFKLVQHNNFYRNFLLINTFFALVIFSPAVIWYKTAYINNIRNPILLYALYLIFGFVVIILLNNFFRNRSVYPNNQKIWILIISIIVYTIFCRILSYTYYNFSIKKYFITCNNFERITINFFTFYFFMFCFIFKDVGKFKNIYIKCFKKKICVFPFLIYFIMLTTIFIEDCTREKYFNQNSTNKILVIINIICFVISLVLSYNFYFEENIEDKSDEVVISDSIKIQSKDKQDLIQSSNFVINNPSNNNNQNQNNNLINNEDKGKKSYYTIKINNFPFMKIYLILVFFWISDESEKLIGIIFMVFLEVLDYLSNDFYTQMKEISEKNKEIKDYNEQNLLVHYYIYYIIIQDMFILSNEITFVTDKFSLGFETDRLQGAKGANISKIIYKIFAGMSKYKYNFIVLGYFLKKDVRDNNNERSKYSIDFMARKILLGIKMGIFIFYLCSQILIYMKDELFPELFAYCFLNFSLYFMDYILSAIGYCIKR